MERLEKQFRTLFLNIPPELRDQLNMPDWMLKMDLRQIADLVLIKCFHAFMRCMGHPDMQDFALRWTDTLARLLVVAHRIRESKLEPLPARDWQDLFSEAEGEDVRVRMAG